MKINELKINSYGKLKEKEIKLDDGINIIYGENEKGKSTLLNFIVNIFYGTSKLKKGKSISDYDKFKPWDIEEFSGKMSYTLDNNKTFEVFREFGKKNPKIYDENKEEISKEYSIDKSSGSQFFYEQTKIDEPTFVSSVVSFQNEVELDNQTQNILLQKIANSSSTGDDSISYKKAMDKLNKKQLDEVGTTRSQGKPINIVSSEIENIKRRNEYLETYKDYKYEVEDKKNKLENEIEKLNVKYEILQKINQINQEEKIEKEKLNFGESKIDEIENEIQELLRKKQELESGKKEVKSYKKEQIKILPYALCILILVVIGIAAFLFSKNVLGLIIPILMAIIVGVMLFMKYKKIKNYNDINERKQATLSEENNDLNKQIYQINAKLDLLEKSRSSQIDYVEKTKNSINETFNAKKENLKYENASKVDSYEFNRIISSNNITNEIESIRNLINEESIELHRLDLDKENVLPKLEELAENEEKLAENQELYSILQKKNEAINLAKEILENAYLKMKSNVTPRFTQNLSNNVSKMTNNKYSNIIINEEDGILVELPSGEYKKAELLSLGTIQQLYLSFRLAVIDNLAEENMPIILDEVFAYYDDNRLKETIKNINDYYADKHQIILFTCTNREEQILNQIGCRYNKVVL